MKRVIFYLLMVIAISSCKSKTEQATTDTIVTPAPNNAETQKLIAEFKPIIQGVWIKKDYINKVIQTKSPAAAMDKAVSVTTMVFNIGNIKADSLIVPVGWDNHEGGELVLRFKSGRRPRTIIYGDSDLGFEINKGDTTLIWYQRDTEKNTIDIIKYKRALSGQPADDLG